MLSQNDSASLGQRRRSWTILRLRTSLELFPDRRCTFSLTRGCSARTWRGDERAKVAVESREPLRSAPIVGRLTSMGERAWPPRGCAALSEQISSEAPTSIVSALAAASRAHALSLFLSFPAVIRNWRCFSSCLSLSLVSRIPLSFLALVATEPVLLCTVTATKQCSGLLCGAIGRESMCLPLNLGAQCYPTATARVASLQVLYLS